VTLLVKKRIIMGIAACGVAAIIWGLLYVFVKQSEFAVEQVADELRALSESNPVSVDESFYSDPGNPLRPLTPYYSTTKHLTDRAIKIEPKLWLLLGFKGWIRIDVLFEKLEDSGARREYECDFIVYVKWADGQWVIDDVNLLL